MPNTDVLHQAMWIYAPTALPRYIHADTATVAMIGYKGECPSYDRL